MPKSTKVQARRLELLLTAHGFAFAFQKRRLNEFCFVRPAPVAGCFEQIRIHCAGRHGEFVPATVRVSIIPGMAQWRGTFEDELIRELADTPEGFARIESDADACVWEDRLARIAPERSRDLASNSGPELLGRTSGARAAAEFYLNAIGTTDEPLDARCRRLNLAASESQRVQAKTMLRWGLLTITGGRATEERAFLAYQIAVYAIVLNERPEEFSGCFSPDADPYKDDELAWCVQIMASRIFGENGWP